MGAHGPRNDTSVVVTVVRSGGFAGLRREWRVQPPAEDAPRWLELIDRCPWDAPRRPDASADRYVWHLRACTGDRERVHEVPDAQLSGAWRALVDAVRDA